MFRLATSQPGKRRQLWLLLSLSALIVVLLSAAVPAPAQGIVIGNDEAPAAAEDTYPTDEEVNSTLQPKILSAVRSGDKTTVTLEIPAGSDTFTSSGMPNTNWAADPNMRVGFNTLNSLGATRSFLAFPLNSIPAGVNITQANLRLYVNAFSPNGDQPMGIQARFLSSSWNPNTLTWANYNPAWGDTIGVGSVPAAVGWVEGNATNPVREWYSGTRANNGIMLQGDETPQQRERVFTTLNANNGLFPRLVVTYETADTTVPNASVVALPQFSNSPFTVQWQGTAGSSGIKWYDVQYQVNGGNWITWRAQVTTTSASFDIGQNGQQIGFRARAVSNANVEQPWSNVAQAATTVDTEAPVSSVQALPQFSQTAFTVSWSGTDNLSGIKHYDVQYRQNGGSWINWQTAVKTTSAQFTNASPGALYEFRCRAVDNVENIQSWSNNAQAATTITGGAPVSRITPFWPSVVNSNTFPVSWSATAGVGTTIASYDVQYRRNGGQWILWQNAIGSTNASFNAPGEGIYEFQVRARNNLGQVGEWSNNAGSSVVVDTTAPFITPKAFLPANLN